MASRNTKLIDTMRAAVNGEGPFTEGIAAARAFSSNVRQTLEANGNDMIGLCTALRAADPRAHTPLDALIAQHG